MFGMFWIVLCVFLLCLRFLPVVTVLFSKVNVVFEVVFSDSEREFES